MIIEALLNLIVNLISLLPFSLPTLPSNVSSVLSGFVDLLDYAGTFIPLFFPFNVTPYLAFSVALIIFDAAHTPIKWIIDKIFEVIP